MLKNFLISIIAITFIGWAQNSVAQNTRGLIVNELFVFAGFSSSTVNAGDQVVFSWGTFGGSGFGDFAISCDFNGLPGLSFSEGSGSFTFTATTSLTVQVFCEETFGFDFPVPSGSATAVLTVNSGAPRPTVNTSFSPSSILLGQSSTFSWSSSNASNCSSTGALSINGTSGSVSFQPNTAGNQTVTVTCAGPGGSRSRSSTLSVQSSTPLPQVSAAYDPNFLFGPGFSTLSWFSTNADFCLIDNFDLFEAAGSIGDIIDFSRLTPVSCTGAGGTRTVFAFIDVFNFFENGNEGGEPETAEEVAGMVHVTGDVLAQPINDSVDPLLDKIMLEDLGIKLSDNNMSSLMIDLNLDDVADRLVFSPETKTMFVLVSDAAGEFTRVNKRVSNVDSLRDIVSVGVNIDGTVTVQMVQ